MVGVDLVKDLIRDEFGPSKSESHLERVHELLNGDGIVIVLVGLPQYRRQAHIVLQKHRCQVGPSDLRLMAGEAEARCVDPFFTRPGADRIVRFDAERNDEALHELRHAHAHGSLRGAAHDRVHERLSLKVAIFVPG